MEQLVNDIGNVRTHLNNTELQLYEANEKISELIESVMYFYILVWLNITGFLSNVNKKNQLPPINSIKKFTCNAETTNIYLLNYTNCFIFTLQQHQLENENKTLKLENSNLTRVARLMTSSMKESVDTSKK